MGIWRHHLPVPALSLAVWWVSRKASFLSLSPGWIAPLCSYWWREKSVNGPRSPLQVCLWDSHQGILLSRGKMGTAILSCSCIWQVKSQTPFKNWGFVPKGNKGALSGFWELLFFVRKHLEQQMLRSLFATLYIKPEKAACPGVELLARAACKQWKAWANRLLASSQMQIYPMIFFTISKLPEATEGSLRPTMDSWASQISHRISLHIALPAVQGWGQVESQHHGCFLQCLGKHIPRSDPKALYQLFFSVAPQNAHKRQCSAPVIPCPLSLPHYLQGQNCTAKPQTLCDGWAVDPSQHSSAQSGYYGDREQGKENIPIVIGQE